MPAFQKPPAHLRLPICAGIYFCKTIFRPISHPITSQILAEFGSFKADNLRCFGVIMPVLQKPPAHLRLRHVLQTSMSLTYEPPSIQPCLDTQHVHVLA